MDTPIADVADTAFWIAEVRARESARPDALFSDHLAERLAGERGAAIARSLPWNEYVAWCVALRTVIIDDLVRQSIATGTDTVLNLGAGLDTRPYRLELPANLRWIEADQAAVFSYKESKLCDERPVCALERWTVDLADGSQRRAVLDRAVAGSRRALVLTEGVVPYLENSDVAELAGELRQRQAIQGWILDFNTRLMMRIRRRQKMVAKTMRNAPFRFQPDDWLGFFHERGWLLDQRRSYPEEARHRGRPLRAARWRRWLLTLRLLFASAKQREEFRHFAGYMLLRPA